MTKFVDKDAVRALAEILNETNLTEIEYEVGEQRVRLSRAPVALNTDYYMHQHHAMPTMAPVAAPAVAVNPASHPGALKSPMVGTVYLSPEPGAAAFAKVGDQIKEGQTLFIIEAMKVLNPIKAPKSGIVSQILVEDSSPVEFGEVLAVIE